jgi:hypothetical protein
MPTSVAIKGSSLINTRKVLLRDYGELVTNRILRELPEDVRDHVESSLVSSWVPIDKLYALLEAIRSELGAIDSDINYRLGKVAPQITYGRFYKMFFKLGKPQLVAKRSPLMWSNLVSAGRVEVVDCDDNGAVGRVRDFPKEVAHPEFCRRLLGNFQGGFELTGVRVYQPKHTKCVLRGDPYCEFSYKWR